MRKVVDVHIGEVKVAKGGDVLKAILGSCVGIGIIWRSRGTCALAHCLLPESPTRTFAIGARFVDQAFLSLLAMLKARPGDHPELEVIIVGGGNMTTPDPLPNVELVGAHNFKVALREARSRNLRIVHSDGGGEEGRKILLDSGDLSCRVEKIPRIIRSA